VGAQQGGLLEGLLGAGEARGGPSGAVRPPLHVEPPGPEERRALLGLWCIEGVGPRTVADLEARVGALSQLLSVPCAEWAGLLSLPRPVRARLQRYGRLEGAADEAEKKVEAGRMEVCFRGEPGFPTGLLEVEDAPPLLFFRGRRVPPQAWVALVGSRRPDPGFLRTAFAFASAVAGRGAGIVSGAAEGVDTAAHTAAMRVGVPTWAFVGSALDELDPAQADLAPRIQEAGGTVFSELPPTVRANKQTFPRRNRLISGAAHVVVVLRAAERSGSLHTAEAARLQRRPVLALPGELGVREAVGCNMLIRDGVARLCRGPDDVWEALRGKPAGARAGGAAAGQVPVEADLSRLSPGARQAYAHLSRTPRDFDDVLADCALGSAALTIALGELELAGLVLQLPGKLYERL
jgi:DNA protecting protein DprA